MTRSDGMEPTEIEIVLDSPPAPIEVPSPETYSQRDELAPATIRVDALGYARAGRAVLDGVSLQIEAGESVAVVGPSGSGKSSLLSLLAGLEQPDAGRIDRVRARPDGLILQGYGLVGVLTAAENVEVALQSGSAGRFAASEIRGRSAAALNSVGLSGVADHLVEELSGGQQQRVAIARALVIDPDVLFADEPTAELDHDWKQHVVDLVLDVAVRGGIVVLATHDPDIASRCTRTIRLVDGRLAPS